MGHNNCHTVIIFNSANALHSNYVAYIAPPMFGIVTPQQNGGHILRFGVAVLVFLQI